MNKRRPELLVPASSLEVLKTACIFGADAVYIGGEAFGLSISPLGCLGSLIIPERLTSSILDCRQGKENVNPTGNFLSLIFFFSMKSPRHSAT